MLDYKPLSIHTGAEVVGVDLSRPLPKVSIEFIDRLLADRCLVLFRDQHLDQQTLVNATAQFGTCSENIRPRHVQSERQKKMLPQILLVTNIREDGTPIGSHPDGEMWFHHDTIHLEIPHKATLLYALEVPTYGGNTVFSNLFAAYDSLPPDLRAGLDGRKAYNAFLYGANKKRDPHATNALSFWIHPAIRTHPANGRKAIYVDRLMTQHLLDVPEEESDRILEGVFDFIEREEFCYEHVWRKGDLVMWDNSSSVHARRDFPGDQIRLMWRTTVLGTTRPC
jgi:taurine dioxygenase